VVKDASALQANVLAICAGIKLVLSFNSVEILVAGIVFGKQSRCWTFLSMYHNSHVSWYLKRMVRELFIAETLCDRKKLGFFRHVWGGWPPCTAALMAGVAE
jgi:hypothetical protein